jgi:hypothetical protein
MRTAEDAIDELQRRGELWQHAPGLIGLGGAALRLFDALDHALAALARREAKQEWQIPPALDFATLARADYFASFPQWLSAVAHLDGDEARLAAVAGSDDPAAAALDAVRPQPIALQPAACYHVYARLADQTVDAPFCVSVRCTCWRHEGERFTPLERGWAFTMREIVCLGNASHVERFRLRTIAAAAGFAAKLGIPASIEAAGDPFFAPTARGRALLQRVKGLKHELRLSVGADSTTAAASFNDHEAFFGEAFRIRLPDGAIAASGCTAFGVERWLLAFLVAHGTDPENWPVAWVDGPFEPAAETLAPDAFEPDEHASAAPAGAPAPDAPNGARRPAPRTAASPLYVRHANAAERGAWTVGDAVDWNGIERELALAQPQLLQQVREAALIESFHPVNLARLMRATWADVDAGVCFSLEAFEGFRHFHALRTYLDVIGHEPAITDAELVALREPAALVQIGNDDLIERLVEFMLSEHLAAYFFRRLSEQAAEPQLAKLLGLIAADEVRHAQSASDLIAKRIAAERSVVPRVLDAAASFRHYGEEALGGSVPVAMHGDPVALRTFAGRVERLCGVRLVDHLKTRL